MPDNHDNMLIAQGDASSVTVASIKSIKYPLDKLNKKVWNSGKESKLKIITADSDDRKAGKDVYVQYRIDFENLDNADIATDLTAYDKRVYIAVSSIYNAGNETMSLTMILILPTCQKAEKRDKTYQNMLNSGSSSAGYC